MIGLTWLHISDRLQKWEKEFDRQVIRAALIRDIGGRSDAGPDLSMMNLIVFCGKIELFLKNFRLGSRSFPDPGKRYTGKPEGKIKHGQREAD